MKKLFIILAFMFLLVPNLGSHIQDAVFFARFVTPYVMIILDTSGTMTWNMAGEATCGDGTIGGDETSPASGNIEDPFYGYRADWGPQWEYIRWWGTIVDSVKIDSTRYGDKSRLYIVKNAMTDVLNEFGGLIRWGLASFYQTDTYDPAQIMTTNVYMCWDEYGNEYNAREDAHPDLLWWGNNTTYAYEQFMLRVNISNAGGDSNKSHINEIKRWLDSDLSTGGANKELRGYGYTPIAPTLRGARYFYQDKINDNNEQKWCRKYFVVLLTDGSPTLGIGAGVGKTAPLGAFELPGNPSATMRNQCYAEADSLRHTYVAASGPKDSAGTFEIKTYVIGVGDEGSTFENIMDSIALKGGTEHYYPATSSDEVVEAFRDIFTDIVQEARAFSAGEVTSIEEEFLSTEYEARLYLASFYPGDSPFWEGHLRALKLVAGGISLDSFPADILIWNAGDILRQRNPLTRNIYGAMGSNLYSLDTFNFSAADFAVGNNDSADSICNLVWSGSAVMDNNAYLGDIFHSSPLRIGSPNYFYHDDDFDVYRDTITTMRPGVIYVGSNTGLLHAFNDSSGEELFAVVPENFIPELKNLRDSHRFYVDADPMAADVWFPTSVNDTFKNWNEWKTILMASQGEGGRAISCLDVTDPSSPAHKFNFATDTMGLTTSTPVMYKVCRLIGADTVERFFAFFGGGECPDSSYDMYEPLSSTPLMGNVIVALDIYDAATNGLSYGSNYWYIPGATGDADSMLYPFVAAGNMVNVDPREDNIYDLLYIPDVAGQLWKVNATNPDVSTWRARCIFRPPIPVRDNDDTKNKNPAQPAFFRPLIERDPTYGCFWVFYGSGDRAHVFKGVVKGDVTVYNRFYAIMDTLVDSTESYPFREDNLYELADTADGFDFINDFPTYRGWLINYNNYTNSSNEKTVSHATLLMDELKFATFCPDSSSDPCQPAAGSAREYSLNFRTGTGRIRGMGTGIPQAPRYSFNMEGGGFEIHQTSDSIWVEQKSGFGVLKRVLKWLEK